MWVRAAAALALVALVAGCSDAPQYEPTQRNDTNQVTLPAGADVEYKLFVRSGDAFDFNWQTTQPVAFDFHGEREGARSGDFTSHKEGTLAADSGAHTAAFTGTHGWYWVNQNSGPVTITIHTDGVYSLVGEVSPSR